MRALEQQNQQLTELTDNWKTVFHERQLAIEQSTKLQFQLADVQTQLKAAQNKASHLTITCRCTYRHVAEQI